MLLFSIDNHEMTVIANDFVPIEPYNTTVVTLGVGQRTDVLVTATGKPTDSVWMRSNISSSADPTVPGCSFASAPYALAAIYYPSANHTATPRSKAQPPLRAPVCANDDLSMTVPYYSMTPDPNPETTVHIDINSTVNASQILTWTMNEQAFRGDYNNPLLLLANGNDSSYTLKPEWSVTNIGSNKTVRVVVHNLTPAPHPMHLHGHDMFLLHEGPGVWNGSITRASNPMRRSVLLHSPTGIICN
jgi:FtsP/CotA-like multicopper oxidase with cupredoxin domain